MADIIAAVDETAGYTASASLAGGTVSLASGPFDPAVNVTLVAVSAGVQATDKNELVLSVDM